MPKKKEVPLFIPEPNPDITNWLVFGLDPSMTRTGYALMEVSNTPGGNSNARWLAAGSVKPGKIDDPAMHPRNTLWIRGKAMALHLRETLQHEIKQILANGCGHWPDIVQHMGLIVSMEYPTPMNDYLVALNRIIHLVFWENSTPSGCFKQVRILYTNASTLRSVMHLSKRGNNKGENILRAYDFIDKTAFPELDSDACDAVLLAMMGRHAASVQLGWYNEIPANILNALCNSTQEIKGAGRNAHLVIKGLLHRPEYWFTYAQKGYEVCVKDAKNPKKTLRRVSISI